MSSMTWTCDGIENKHDMCRGEVYVRRVFESLRKNTVNIINLEKKKVIQLTNEQRRS